MDYIQSDTKHYIVKGIRVTAILVALIGIGSIVAAFAGKDNHGEAFFGGIGLLISSIFTYSFSYIVEAACLYIEKRHEEIDSSAEDSE